MAPPRLRPSATATAHLPASGRGVVLWRYEAGRMEWPENRAGRADDGESPRLPPPTPLSQVSLEALAAAESARPPRGGTAVPWRSRERAPSASGWESPALDEIAGWLESASACDAPELAASAYSNARPSVAPASARRPGRPAPSAARAAPRAAPEGALGGGRGPGSRTWGQALGGTVVAPPPRVAAASWGLQPLAAAPSGWGPRGFLPSAETGEKTAKVEGPAAHMTWATKRSPVSFVGIRENGRCRSPTTGRCSCCFCRACGLTKRSVEQLGAAVECVRLRSR